MEENLNIDQRIYALEQFISEQENKPQEPTSTLEEPAPQLPSPDNVITLLKKISENQEIDRKRFERSNPVEADDPIYDWAEATIDPGEMVQFVYIIPEGHVFYLEYVNIVHNVDTTYYIWIDGTYQPTLTYAIEDFGDHMPIWKPPKMCYNRVEVWALNNGIIAQTYSCFFRGFNRWYRNIKREITYESLEKEKQET